jgi:glycolate oxidase iron-sulfur subunit
MRALERGEIPASDAALREHLDRCLGCRGCEPVCPSGVKYGRGLEAAREILSRDRSQTLLTRLALSVFGSSALGTIAFTGMRLLRGSGVAAALAGAGRFGFGMGMIASTRAGHPRGRNGQPIAVKPGTGGPRGDRVTVKLFRGCVMDGLFSHVHEATRRTLEANGYRVVEVDGQGCCGALHDHAGSREQAGHLAQRNLQAFGDTDFIVVNSAGCGALLKDYGHLLGTPAAERFGARVRDVAELLAAKGPARGGSLQLRVAYDAPCHLQHAQRIHEEPLAVLRAIPGLAVDLLPGSDRCCGSAGIFSVTQPEMSRAVLAEKVSGFAAALPRPDLVVTGNPGCHMQLGAGLRAAGLNMDVRHPVELLDWSYAAGGIYGS